MQLDKINAPNTISPDPFNHIAVNNIETHHHIQVIPDKDSSTQKTNLNTLDDNNNNITNTNVKTEDQNNNEYKLSIKDEKLKSEIKK